MRIIELQIENFKNIKIAEVTPTGGTVIISGENGAGKSAILNAFWMALDQKGAIKDNPDPIKHGEKNAKVTVDLGKYIVTRTWTKKKTFLKIENADGAVFRSPGAMLTSLIGELSFDPQAFTLMNEKDQLDTLINILDLPIDIPLLDTERAQLYSDRTIVNREITALKGQRDGIVIPDDVPADEVSTADIMAEYQVASDTINTNTIKRLEHSNATDLITSLAQRISEVTEKLNGLNNELDVAYTNGKQLEAEVDRLIDPDLEVFKCRLDDVEKTNILVRKKQEREELNIRFNEKTADSKNITAAIEHIDNQKANAIKNASMPVLGLSFNETGVLYNEVKLKGCSTFEQMKVSIGIAMAINPDLRVIRITDGSLIDDNNMKAIEEMAEEHDFQVWIERVDSSGKVGVFIQEGEIVADNQVPAKEDEPDKAQDEMPEMPNLTDA
ncbi:MAG: AAA family ATPase [Candidatus Thorarchaeota archaeon]